MLKSLVVALGVAFICTGFATDASAGSGRSKWSNGEDRLVQRYSSREICDERGAPAWGRASMHRWRNAQRYGSRR